MTIVRCAAVERSGLLEFVPRSLFCADVHHQGHRRHAPGSLRLHAGSDAAGAASGDGFLPGMDRQAAFSAIGTGLLRSGAEEGRRIDRRREIIAPHEPIGCVVSGDSSVNARRLAVGPEIGVVRSDFSDRGPLSRSSAHGSRAMSSAP